MAYMKKQKEDSVVAVDWGSYLPKELLGVILDKLIHLSDYIRFGAVCKSWNSVALDHKQARIANINRQPPLLLISAPEKGYNRSISTTKLYSISENKFYNCQLEIPHRSRLLASSCGWLAVEEADMSLKLMNPFTGKTINLPGLDSCADEVRKVILSCDPCSTRSAADFCVAAIYGPCLDEKFAFLMPDEKSWTEEVSTVGDLVDIIFHKGKLYVLYVQALIVIDYRRFKYDHQFVTKVELGMPYGNLIAVRFDQPYLVEDSNGDLLLLMEVPHFDNHYSHLGFIAHKLVKETMASSDEEKLCWEKVQDELDNDHAFFFGGSYSLCISASCFPRYKPRCVYYFTRSFGGRDYDGIGVYNLDDMKARKLHCLKGSQNRAIPIAWISPTLR